MREAIGLAGAAIGALAAVFYVVDVVKGSSRPHRVSWGVWAIIGFLGASSAQAGGAGPGAYVAFVYFVNQVVIFGLSLVPRYGKPGARRIDYALGGMAVASIIAWKCLGLSASFAASVAVIADALAAWPTLREAWLQPEFESTAVWSIDTLSAVLGVLALRKRNFASAAFPTYLVAVIGSTAAILIYQDRRLARR